MKSSNSLNGRDDLILVGRVVGVHGIGGNLKVHSYAEALCLYESPDGIQVALADGSVKAMVVRRVRPHGRGLLMNLETVTDRDRARALVGAKLYAPKTGLPPLEADTYYWSDLMGLTVIDTQGNRLGVLDAVIPTPGNDVYVIRKRQGESDQELLLPAIGDVIREVDIEAGTMVVDPPEGL